MPCHAPPCPPRPPYLPPLAPGTPGPGGTGAVPLLYGEQRAGEGLAAGATSLPSPSRPPSLPLMDAVQGCALFCAPHWGSWSAWSIVGNAAHKPAAAGCVLPALQALVSCGKHMVHSDGRGGIPWRAHWRCPSAHLPSPLPAHGLLHNPALPVSIAGAGPEALCCPAGVGLFPFLPGLLLQTAPARCLEPIQGHARVLQCRCP